jgi:NMD protein affecting ribosome stability and mRNA decay
MSELKACPFCGNQSAVMDWLPSLSGIVEYPFCEYCGAQCETAELWNTRPIEDGLRAELAAAQAASDKRGEIAQEYYLRICNLEGELAGTQVERNNARAEVERLRGIIREAEFSTDLQTSVDSFVAICPICSAEYSWGHNNDCPFYQWEGGAQ